MKKSFAPEITWYQSGTLSSHVFGGGRNTNLSNGLKYTTYCAHRSHMIFVVNIGLLYIHRNNKIHLLLIAIQYLLKK